MSFGGLAPAPAPARRPGASCRRRQCRFDGLGRWLREPEQLHRGVPGYLRLDAGPVLRLRGGWADAARPESDQLLWSWLIL